MGDERPEWLDQWKQWPKLAANQRGALYFVPPQLLQRPTPRLLLGAQRLCEALEDARRGAGGGGM
jgi:iron complex transport system substrate-binding protein